MSKKEEGSEPCEIVIVRRKRNGDDCHHGGVWKVAYADFMTAMMAFFLVMWLINAANEETRSQVASYFNPVKLVDTTTNPRGLQENKDSSSGDVENRELKSEATARSNESPANAFDDKQKYMERKRGPATYFSGGDIPESDLFRDPLRTLDKIAGGAPDLLKGSARPLAKPRALGAAGGEEFRDPFSPRSWESLEQILPQEAPEAVQEDARQQRDSMMAGQKRAHKGDDRPHPAMATSVEPEVKGGQVAARQQRQQQAVQTVQQQREGSRGGQSDMQGEAVKEIRNAIKRTMAAGEAAKLPAVTVRRITEGILISLTDRKGFGMFDVGSARPRPQTVRFLEQIARILKRRPGAIVIRGHTDARPFRNAHYDNWRLSTARAHMARYMLLRGGVDARRIVRVEGHADRSLADPAHPLAAKNRRIEILLMGAAGKSNSPAAAKRKQGAAKKAARKNMEAAR